MKTTVLPVNEVSIARAAALIKAGELVAFPTETVYGLGANALDGAAVAGIFRAKGRPSDNPLIVHVSATDQIEPLIQGPLGETAAKLAEAYWPGPLTMIFPKSDRIPPEVSAGLSTVGIRMPAHPAARALIEEAGLPIAAPSANASGRPSPTTAAHVLEDMDGRIGLILDGGPCSVGVESTVLDVTCDPPRVLRPGGVTPEMVRRVAGGVSVDGSVLRPLREGETARSPGMKYRHYAPRGHLTIVRGGDEAVAREICRRYDEAAARGLHCAVLCRTENAARYADRALRPLGGDAGEMAAQLFAALREMDGIGAQLMLCEAVEASEMGLAVMNRMGRAAAFDVVEAGE